MIDSFSASRRRLLGIGLTTLAGSILLPATADAQDADSKVEQSVVQYQNTPKDGQKCSGCANFVVPNGCKVVSGNISPEGWCVAYVPKGS